MNLFFEKLGALVGVLRTELNKIFVPIAILAAIVTLVMMVFSDGHDKEKYKKNFIYILIACVVYAAIGYVIPWIVEFFSDVPVAVPNPETTPVAWNMLKNWII